MNRDIDNPSETPWPELLAGYVLGDLTSDDRIRVQHYLTLHPEAQEEIDALEASLALLPMGLSDRPVPSQIKTNLFNQIAPNPAPNPVFQMRPSRRWSMLAGGLAAAAIAALGLHSYQLQTQLQSSQQQVAALRSNQQAKRDRLSLVGNVEGRKLPMVGSGVAQGATGEVFIIPTQNRAVLAVDNMPQPPEGQVYHLWAVVDGQKVACIQFLPEQDGKVLMQLPANRWTQAVKVVVTLESLADVAMPTGEMVMAGDRI